MKARSLVFLALLLQVPHLLAPHGLSGQETLNEVESLLARGMIFQARDRLAAWWDEDRPQAGRTELQRGIWLRGALTVDPSLAALDYRRLALEFPGGPYSDHALLRLARAAEARGDLQEAVRHYRVLARDYLASPLRPAVTDWLSRNREAVEAFQAGEESESVGSPDPAAGSGEVRGGVPEPHEPEGGASESAEISIQLGAFRNLDGARKLLTDAGRAGYEARLVRVPGSPLIRVRLGYFPTRDAAMSLRQELTRRGWESTIVFDAQKEEGVGRSHGIGTPSNAPPL